MHQALMLWAAALGVDVGWQPVPGGGYEYIIQIEPEMLESLREGQEIESDIPHFLRDVRSYRIRVGTDILPQEGPPPEMEPLAEEPAAPAEGLPTAEQEGSAVETEPPAEEPASTEEPPADDASSVEGPDLSNDTGADSEAPETEVDQPSRREPENEPDRTVEPTGRYGPFGSELDERPTLDPPGEDQDEVSGEEAPETFVADDSSLPIVNQAGYRRDGAAEESAGDDSDTQAAGPQPATAGTDEEGRRPWLAFTLALLGLFASLGGNCYLGILTWGFRGRYLQLLEERKWRRQQPVKNEDESDSAE
jgi:hypothetical protein